MFPSNLIKYGLGHLVPKERTMNDITNTEVAVEALPEVPAEATLVPEVTEEGHAQVGEGPVADEASILLL